MTRIIQHGDKWVFKREAYDGCKVTCKSCNCVFEITSNSKVSHTTGGDVASGRVACPECGITENEIVIARRRNRHFPMKSC